MLLEWKKRSTNERPAPNIPPTTRDATISIIGSSTIESTLGSPANTAFAAPKHTANITRPIASSSATTGRSIVETGPFALYCLITISVAAGAVAAAIAPIISATGRFTTSGITKLKATSPPPTRIVARTAAAVDTIAACFPIAFT